MVVFFAALCVILTLISELFVENERIAAGIYKATGILMLVALVLWLFI